MEHLATGAGSPSDVLFQYWGTRGSRGAVHSRIGRRTSCYSLAAGADLFVFDAGSGLLELSAALLDDARLAGVRRVHVLVSHAHMDHWEGLKDADWMWRKQNGLERTILAPREALLAIQRAHEPPSFVPLEVLAVGTLARFAIVELPAGKSLALPGALLETVALHHYSGVAPEEQALETLGFRLTVTGGPTVAYLCDHEPVEATLAHELAMVRTANLAVVNASYSDVAEHAFGHGSVEYAARLARRAPDVAIVAGHHGALRSDEVIEAAVRRHGADCANLALAVEGRTERWDAAARRFG